MSLSSSLIRFANATDHLIQKITLSIAWVYVLLVIAIIAQVTMRYAFGGGHPIMEELQWHLYAVGIMFGLSYTQTVDSHIRVDVVADRLSRKTRLFWEIFGILFLAFPFMFIVFYNSLDFVYESWRVNESSDAPVGLPWRWAIKSVIPISFGLLTISLITRLIRDVVEILSGRKINISGGEDNGN